MFFFTTTSVKTVFCRRCIETQMHMTLLYDNLFFFLVFYYKNLTQPIFTTNVTCVTTFQPLSDFSFIITPLFIERKLPQQQQIKCVHCRKACKMLNRSTAFIHAIFQHASIYIYVLYSAWFLHISFSRLYINVRNTHHRYI